MRALRMIWKHMRTVKYCKNEEEWKQMFLALVNASVPVKDAQRFADYYKVFLQPVSWLFETMHVARFCFTLIIPYKQGRVCGLLGAVLGRRRRAHLHGGADYGCVSI